MGKSKAKRVYKVLVTEPEKHVYVLARCPKGAAMVAQNMGRIPQREKGKWMTVEGAPELRSKCINLRQAGV